MKLIKTSLLSAISTAVTFISGFIVTKFVAIKIGPVGMTYVGQYQNMIALTTMFSTLAVTTGVIKYLSEHKEEHEKKIQITSTAFLIVLISSSVVSLFVFVARGALSRAVFHNDEFADIFGLYGCFVIIIALNALITAFYNGLKEIGYLMAINIAGSLTGIGFTVLFASRFGVKGVLIANNFTVLVIFIINILLLHRKQYFQLKPRIKKSDGGAVKLLLGFTSIGIVSGLLAPVTQILVRDKIIMNFSAVEAGWWQAVTRISDYYLAFITTVLAIYYLPRLSEIKDKAELKQEIKKGYQIILPVVGSMALLIWICKVWVVHILFSKEFLPMIPLFKFQLLGDFFKIGSWLLAYILIARAAVKVFILTEVIFSLSLVVLSYLLVDQYGVIGTTYAFCINYFFYWITMYVVTRKYF